MYQIEFYEKRNGVSDVWDFLEDLREKSGTNKDARIQYEQIVFYLDLLARNGTRLPSKITKYLEDDIWETTAYSISITQTVNMFCCTTFGRKARKHRRESLPVQKRHGTITFVSERSEENENMGRLQESRKVH